MKKILFICKYNRFRSQVAEAIFRKLTKNKIDSESAGILLDKIRPYISDVVKDLMKEKGYEITRKPKLIKKDLEEYTDIIIVANNIDKNLINFHKKILQWNIPDCDESDLEKIKTIINQIENEVKTFIVSNHFN